MLDLMATSVFAKCCTIPCHSPGNGLNLALLENQRKHIQATLLNPDMCNLDFRLNQTDRKVTVPSYTRNSYMHNPDFA